MTKKLFGILLLTFAFSGAAFAQEEMGEKSPTDADKVANFDKSGVIKRGEAIGKADKADLKKVMADPAKFDGKTILVQGVIVRSCKMEGCWLDLAPAKD